MPKNMNQYIVSGAHLDPADKDSVKKCISGFICELGELDATFRKADIARLKAFLSNEVDLIRLPYDRVTSSFKRRTSFCASVNPKNFLTDGTGARRFLPLAVVNCNPYHDIDMQQLWAQVFELYKTGYIWWCSTELEILLSAEHKKHAEVIPVEELISSWFDLTQLERTGFSEHLTVTGVLNRLGIAVPNALQIKQARAFIEEAGFKEVQRAGVRGYWLARHDFYSAENVARDIVPDSKSRERYYKLYPDQRPKEESET
jgi:putative DNA primase/helicase